MRYDRAVNNPDQTAHAASQTRGIVMLIVGLSLAALSGALMKLLGEGLSAFQVAWFRFTGMALLLFPYLLWRYGVAGLKPARPLIQLVRGLSMAAGTTTFVIGAASVDYADAIAILYAYPFVLVIIAALFLGEQPGPAVWTGVTVGFIGVLLVMRPEFEQINTGTLYIFACAVIVAIQLALNRKLGSVSPPLVTAFAGALCASLALAVILPGTWVAIPDEAWPYIGMLILSGAVNQTLLVYAFAHADASTLAPFTYTEIISAVIFGYLFFATLPALLSWLGILLIAGSGWYVSRVMRMRSPSRRSAKI